MERAYLLLGSNTGDRALLMNAALVRIELLVGRIIKTSSIYETQPWGKTDQPAFLNQAIVVETSLAPELLLFTLQDIERSLGRVRTGKWEPRSMDIDIVLYGNAIVNEPDLVIPHAGMAERRFVLVPLAEIAGAMVHPTSEKTINQLLDECPDTLSVEKIPQ